MNYVEAKKLLAAFKGEVKERIHLAASGNVDPLILFIRAEAASRGRAVDVITLPFGTLAQSMLLPKESECYEIVLLTPWDLIPECDWRSGIPVSVGHPEILLSVACDFMARVSQRQSALIYLPAPIPPLYLDSDTNEMLSRGLLACVMRHAVHLLEPACFGIGGYLSSGVPISGTRMGAVAEEMMNLLVADQIGSAKILVTDLDNVLWAGVIAEDGCSGIECGPEGKGYRHFLYQGFLLKLKAAGVLLAAVSRNDVQTALQPISEGKTLLKADDFVHIAASYDPKSVHIGSLAARLNLGLDSFIFVDDNPIELAEVGSALPLVQCLQFPSSDDGLLRFFSELTFCFRRKEITDEDRQRTELYKRQLQAAITPDLERRRGADLTHFLSSLKMELEIHDRSNGGRERAIQLINKTNQFNLNGIRVVEAGVQQVISKGGKLYTGKLNDRTGSHGEILACLLDRDLRIMALVLSCRVFQRRVEYAFLSWLIKRHRSDMVLDYRPTERNTPMTQFLSDSAIMLDGSNSRLDSKLFLNRHAENLQLFKIDEVGIV